MKICHVFRHVAHEGLGAFEQPLVDAGFAIRFHDAWAASRMSQDEVADAALLIVMGGPMGAYETERYAFLQTEIATIAARLDHELPTLGVCLGAQLIARAAGARVYAGVDLELGYAAVALTEAGRGSCLAPLHESPRVLHWHGDTFDLPNGATRLASSAMYGEQAFAIGTHALALQFHLEVEAAQIDAWIDAGAADLARARVAPDTLRSAAIESNVAFGTRARRILTAWLENAGEMQRA
jgi:GMP synthase (glutamine-hydrolysing)